MPKPLKVKLFMDTSASAIEEKINAWLAQVGPTAIIKMETAVAAAAERPEDGGKYPCIVVTVWYELPA